MNNHHIYGEDLVKIHAGFMIAVSASVSPDETCLVDSVGQVLLVSSITSDYYNLSSPFSTRSPELQEERPDEDLQFRLSLNNVWQ